VLLILCIFWQAGHVAQMKFRNLALEGDASLQAIPLLIIVSVCGAVLQVIFEHVSKDYLTAVIVQTVWYMLFPIVLITTTFVPKVSNSC